MYKKYICKAMYDHYQKQRRLDNDAKIMATKMVNMKVNKNTLHNDLMRIQNKIVTLRDIQNLVISNSSASDALKILVKHYKNSNVTLHITKNCNNKLKAIYSQDFKMQRIFSLCPDILFVDAIYKVDDFRLPLYMFLGLFISVY